MMCHEIGFYLGGLRSGGLTAGNVIFGLLITNTLDRKARSLFDPGGVIEHGNCIPRTMLGAKGTADTAFDIHFDHLLKLCEIHTGNNFNAIYGTEYDTGLASGATVLINNGQKTRL